MECYFSVKCRLFDTHDFYKDIRAWWLKGLFSVIVKKNKIKYFSCAAGVSLKPFIKEHATTLVYASLPWRCAGRAVCKQQLCWKMGLYRGKMPSSVAFQQQQSAQACLGT